MTTGADVVTAARQHLGTRWMHQHRLPGVAMDCAGLVICVARQLGLVPPDFDISGYGRQPDGTLVPVCDRHMVRISALELGAVLVLRVPSQPQHLGIVGDYRGRGFTLIHACAVRGQVIEHRLLFNETVRLVGAYCLPGVAA